MTKRMLVSVASFVLWATLAGSFAGAVGSSEAAAGTATLRILSLNIYGIPYPWNDRTRWDDMGQLLRARREAGLGPDVVAIQEAFIGDADRLMRAAGFKYLVRGPSKKGTQFAAGLQILSDLPLEGRFLTSYTRCTSWDCMARKGAVGVKIQMGDAPQPIYFYNTHLNANPDTDPSADPEHTAEIRYSQMQELRELITETKPSEAPLIAVGDFNMASDGYDYESWLAFTLTTDAVESCARPGHECSGAGDAPQTWRKLIDHQFYLNGVSPGVRMRPVHYERIFTEPYHGRALTDHPGLLVHYEVNW
jgi:endonuclease/exonuclease/phosphatase family metal-dependent hydrolase